MEYFFCTLFDRNYLFRGLALYKSLRRHGGNRVVLYVLCLDVDTYELLQRLALAGMVLIQLDELETAEVLEAKSTRTKLEYYWMLASVLTEHVMSTITLGAVVTYVDSDVYFYASPEFLYKDLGNGSVLIVEHGYPPELSYLNTRSGRYNVGVVMFRNDQEGRQCLSVWRAQCLRWCYNRHEPGRFGDQMYLDAWPSQYRGVRVCRLKGAGLAPWNVSSYKISKISDEVILASDALLIFYHFHSLRILADGGFVLHARCYKVSMQTLDYIYTPYLCALREAVHQVVQVDPGFRYGFGRPESAREIYFGLAKRLLIKCRYRVGVLLGLKI